MKTGGYIKLLFLLIIFTGFASAKEIRLRYLNFGEIDMAAFKLTSEAAVKITGKGALFHGYEDRGSSWNNDLFVYGWIIDSDTRKVVWNLSDKFREHKSNSGVFDFSDEKTLKPGEYEIYFTGMFNTDGDRGEDWWRKIFGSDRGDYNRRDLEKLGMTISSSSSAFSETNIEGVADRYRSKAIASFIRTGDEKTFEHGFTLKGNTKLKVYALGEARDESVYDYAWIYDVSTNKRVWALNYKNSKHAGGADKNILYNGEISLPKGSYKIKYISDDSHSFESWNSLPPDDPQFWGVTVWASSENDLKNVVPFNPDDVAKPIVELIRVGDDETVSQGFKLGKDTKIRILSVGEGTDEMYDYGWIIDADTRKTVWKMELNDTEHAGGADKNRMVDKEITLKKGSYIAYYSTDDSHSYFDWNSSAPYDQERWGITIWTVNESDRASVTLFNEKDFKSPGVLAEIVRVKDNDFESKEFSLDKETRVRVYAIGEGVRGGMADYGWIENDATGRKVWEMNYRKTDDAGGANKNRMVTEVLTLPKGKYRIYYETDGSHSYKDWNASPPDDQERYGITVTLEK